MKLSLLHAVTIALLGLATAGAPLACSCAIRIPPPAHTPGPSIINSSQGVISQFSPQALSVKTEGALEPIRYLYTKDNSPTWTPIGNPW